MKKIHLFVFGSIHIQSVIDRLFTALLVDPREHKRIHYSNEDKDEEDDSDASTVYFYDDEM